jgi:hypothetical protein
MMRLVIPSVTALALGIEVVLASFLAGILDIPMHRPGTRCDAAEAPPADAGGAISS